MHAYDPDGFPRPQGTHADPSFSAYADVPQHPAYPSYHTDAQSTYSEQPAYPPQILPFSSVPPPQPADGLVKRLSLRLMPVPDPEYKSPEQLAEEDRTLDDEEKEMLKRGMFNWDEMRRWRYWIRKEWWGESWRTRGEPS